ncbi:MAG: ATP-binding cassette domain-containing protein [Bacteroidales bacterium]|nr:ATP-binding cassette domain-containing protein [Bacteroidales bacterium]MBN2818115.1 ATP-binding cassette domain-containing protein [Bacteroidales bacterium]
MSFFEARNITKQYAGHLALDDVSVHIDKGLVYGFLGPNGAGKTTLIRIINRITAPDSGEVLIDGRKITSEDILKIGYLPEERGLYKKMKVGEQSLYLARLKGLKKNEALKQLNFWFDKFEIQSWWNKKIEELSKGMAQKVQFIITLLHNPDILILDEPLSGFDPVNASQLKQEIKNLRNEGKTIILSTHDMSSVEELCDKICLINKSKAILEGRVADIKQEFKSNKFEVVYSAEQSLDGFLQEKFQLVESGKIDTDKQFAIVKIPDLSINKSQGNELIKSIVDKAVIHSFSEILPSMTEVFIQSVGSNSNTDSNE